ncbi:hypothetical protein LTR94_006852 [Friedmanniomyces endolithicus]|uniref:DUF2461 domain-containing protein n=1 Tax=Rachicladosporium monterosium TaxID=1507873 RepID=A0ABR0LF42_9PEZI|nr:hypothetical protein LTR94_006852 [Friedmanniomyces endolithicus]KAK5147865.1 hypothetical protein LTR32_000742 [Rachicladosporium monterosium]
MPKEPLRSTMARKSERLSTGTGSGAAHKRVASTTAIPRSEAKRPKTKKATPTKSQHFQADEDAEDEEGEPSSGDDDVESAFDDDGDASSSEAEPVDDGFNSGSEDEPKQRKKPAPRKTAQNPGTASAHEGQQTNLEPGTQLIIRKPKARPAGKTPYGDSTIHPNTLLFLKDLAANNNREWLKMNDAEFRQAEKDWHSFVEQLTERLAAIDDTIPELPVKDVVFRIYRDVRFSPDPTPYKSRTGRKGPYAHYYIQISHRETLIALDSQCACARLHETQHQLASRSDASEA